MSNSAEKIEKYVQETLYNGRQPDDQGFYIFSHKELYANLGVASKTISDSIEEVVCFFAERFDLARWAKYDELKGEQLYLDVSYEKGVLRFRRNPITIDSNLDFLWGLPPIRFDFFDEKHRRRCYGSNMKYDAIPYDWDADQYEEEINKAREAIKQHQKEGSTKQVQINTKQERFLVSIYENGGRIISKIAEKNLTYEICLAAVSNDGKVSSQQAKTTQTQKEEQNDVPPTWRDKTGKIICLGDDCKAKCDDRCPIWWNTRGVKYLTTKQPFPAISNLEKAIAIAPDFAEAYNNLGAAHGAVNHHQQAYDAYGIN